jgi:uncharacterized protein
MLVFDLRTLATTAAQVDDVLAADDPVWHELDPRPASGLHVTGRLSAAGPGRFYFSGQMAGDARGECRRCLTEVQAPVSEPVHSIFVEQGSDDLDDPDVFLFDPRPNVLDLRPSIREQWLVAAPAFLQCRDECKGLCPTCGADLNAGTCACEPAISR